MPRELITLEVAGQAFGIDIMAIREIRVWSPVERLPSAPPHIAGVVNLRGTILPVVDLSARLDWGPSTVSARHAIIVAQLDGQLRGFIVESVSDILSIPDDALQPPPVLEHDRLQPYLDAMAVVDDRMIMVLDLRALYSDDCGQARLAA